MCRPVRCRTCGKTTWAGCGDHIEEALYGVALADRCLGHDDQPATESSFFARVFGH